MNAGGNFDVNVMSLVSPGEAGRIGHQLRISEGQISTRLQGMVKRIVIKDVSHWLMLDDPQAVNAALDEVLAWTK